MTVLSLSLSEIIENAKKTQATTPECIQQVEAFSSLEDLIDNASSKDRANWIYWYAENVVEGRIPELEVYVLQDPVTTYWYCRKLVSGRWTEAENVIINHPNAAYLYARHVMKQRWSEAEFDIATDVIAWEKYTLHFGI